MADFLRTGKVWVKRESSPWNVNSLREVQMKEMWITFNEALPPHKIAIVIGVGFLVWWILK